jgi:DNA-binding GntR family transcriptional regulator
MNATFGVSRTVVRNALDVLASDGLVYRVKGKGTIVAAPKTSYLGSDAVRRSMDHADTPAPVLSKLIESRWAVAGEDVGGILGLGPTEMVLEMHYVLDLDGAPASIIHYFMAPSALGGVCDDVPSFEVGGPDVVVQLAAVCGYDPRRRSVIIEASVASQYESEILGLSKGTPIFVLTTTDRAADDAATGFSRSVVRSDLFRFSVDLENRPSQLGAAHFRIPRPVR